MRKDKNLILARVLHDLVIRDFIHKLQPLYSLCFCEADELLPQWAWSHIRLKVQQATSWIDA